ncbi:MAG: O-antigen ligase family protein [Burkholderiales bacterium]
MTIAIDRARGKTYSARPPRSFTAENAAAVLCGAAIGIKADFVGEISLLEPLAVLLALYCFLARGLGKGFVAAVYFGFIGAGLLTLCGYLFADLVAANEPWQYLKGWGRVVFLVIDCAALMILAAHDRKNIWWLALGMGLGGVAALAAQGLPLSTWKLGYGEYCALVVVACAGLFPQMLSVLGIAAFGVICVFTDYRSLGAASLLASGLLWYGSFRARERRHLLGQALALIVPAAAAASLLYAALSTTDERIIERRQLSNSGRYIGLVVAWRAVLESPVIGYGSWAAEKRFGRMLRDEARQFEQELNVPIDLGRSLIPHSQWLQSWVEGGLLGLSFFLVYAWGLVAALRWFVWHRKTDRLQALGLFILVMGAWNLVASPFLGFTRIHIALAVAVIAIAYHERALANALARNGLRRRRQVAPRPAPAPLVRRAPDGRLRTS